MQELKSSNACRKCSVMHCRKYKFPSLVDPLRPVNLPGSNSFSLLGEPGHEAINSPQLSKQQTSV